MRFLFLFFFIGLTYAQTPSDEKLNFSKENSSKDSLSSRFKKNNKSIRSSKPPIDLYKIYSLNKDTTYVDTSLTIKSEYKYNFLRKDIFGLLPFVNEGHVYNTLDFGLNSSSLQPNFGFKAKHFNYLEVQDINYYSVPTPLTDLYFKTVMEQGQSLDAFLTVNTKPNLNISIAYKGLRSLGKYVNNLTSSGNFRFTTSYFTKNKRYFLNAHFTGQDISNQENGGIVNVSDFETSTPPYNQRDRIEVYFTDATSLLKGNRFFIEHSYKLTKSKNEIILKHHFNHEYKFFEFTQSSANSRFGTSFSNSIKDKTRYNHFYNKFSVALTTKKFGDLEFFIDDNNYNHYYQSLVLNSNSSIAVPSSVSDRINIFGGSYFNAYKKIDFRFNLSQSITNQSISNLEFIAGYKFDSKNSVKFSFQKLNSIPNLNFTLHQSAYVDYNWFNNFKNEKLSQFDFSATTKWINLNVKYKIINDHLYFDNLTNDITELSVSPMQYDKTLNYFSVKANKEIKFWKFALDNTVLFQDVQQSDLILNVPQIVTRNTLYYSGFLFKKAMQIQTGVTFQYFSKYYANDYNPLIGEFYVQNETKIGDFPMIDFFVNARIKQTRIFLKAEHLNSSFTGYDFYSAPNYPYRDFMIRFGLVWNFFQ